MHLDPASAEDVASFERSTLEALGMPQQMAMRHRLPHFGHLFSGDSYSAGYYSYLWSDTLSADAFEAFTEAGGPYDKAVAKRLREAGAILVGKTNTPEFGLVPFTEPELFGPTLTPWDTTRTSGGSSDRVSLMSSPFEAPDLGRNAYDFTLINLDYHDTYWENAERKIPQSMNAYDLVLRGRDAYARNTRSANNDARKLFEQAIAVAAAASRRPRRPARDPEGPWARPGGICHVRGAR